MLAFRIGASTSRMATIVRRWGCPLVALERTLKAPAWQPYSTAGFRLIPPSRQFILGQYLCASRQNAARGRRICVSAPDRRVVASPAKGGAGYETAGNGVRLSACMPSRWSRPSHPSPAKPVPMHALGAPCLKARRIRRDLLPCGPQYALFRQLRPRGKRAARSLHRKSRCKD